MAGHAITLEIPDSLYDGIKRAADRSHRLLAEVVLEAVTALGPIDGSAPIELKSALAHLAYLNDGALWQAARASMSAEQKRRSQELHDLQASRLLCDEERTEDQALVRLYRATVLLRAQAAVLLKQRGYDVADPGHFAQLE